MLDHDDILGRAGHAYAVSQRLAAAGPLDYLILVPTLRCNLSCSYCPVSRVNAGRSGFDWHEDTLAAVLACLQRLPRSEERRVGQVGVSRTRMRGGTVYLKREDPGGQTRTK